MMIHQFKRGSGPGVGFAIDGVDFDKLYSKIIGECSGLKPNEKSPSSTNTELTKITPPKPSTMSKLNPKDGVYIEPPKAPPQKQDQPLKRTHLTLFMTSLKKPLLSLNNHIGVHALPVKRRVARPRGPRPQGDRPVCVPCGILVIVNMTMGLVVVSRFIFALANMPVRCNGIIIHYVASGTNMVVR
jgi:hypothetical protein